MGTVSIVTNISAQLTANNIRRAMDDLKASSVRLSSGQQITQASDDAAGLSIGSGLANDEATSRSALTTSAQATAILSIAEGGMANISSIASRLKSLASKANSGALGANELGYIKKEMDSLLAQVDTVVTTTKFNGSVLLDGTYTAKAFQVGLLATDTITVGFAALKAADLSINAIDVTSNVATANTALDTAINTIKTARAQLGADQARFNYAANNIESIINNLSAAKSIYLDADFAKVSTEFANQNTQLQAGVATLAQVNSLTSNLLKLISQ